MSDFLNEIYQIFSVELIDYILIGLVAVIGMFFGFAFSMHRKYSPRRKKNGRY